MAAWFILQPVFAKKTYITIVVASEMAYMPRVEPMSKTRQPEES